MQQISFEGFTTFSRREVKHQACMGYIFEIGPINIYYMREFKPVILLKSMSPPFYLKLGVKSM